MPKFRSKVASTSILRSTEFGRYVIGQGLVLVGAWLLNETGSMLPLALGASASLMFTLPLVRRLSRRPSPGR